MDLWQQGHHQKDERLCEHILLKPDTSGFCVCFSGNELHAQHFLYRENFLIILRLVVIEEPIIVRGQTEEGLMQSYSCIFGHFIIDLPLYLLPQVIYPGGFSLSPYKNYPLDNSWCLGIFFDNHV